MHKFLIVFNYLRLPYMFRAFFQPFFRGRFTILGVVQPSWVWCQRPGQYGVFILFLSFPPPINVTDLSCSYPCSDVTILHKNPIHASEHVNIALFILIHSYTFHPSRGYPQGLLTLLTKCISTHWEWPREGWNK
jgi:hypothetical protein